LLAQQEGKQQPCGARQVGEGVPAGILVESGVRGTPSALASHRVGHTAGCGSRGPRAELGSLYVPRPWPVVRVGATLSAAEGGEVSGVKAPEGPNDGGEQARGSEAATQAVPATQHLLGNKVGGKGKGRLTDDDHVAAAADELREAYKFFRQHDSSCKQYHEVQVRTNDGKAAIIPRFR
jgi:hypothetical protein